MLSKTSSIVKSIVTRPMRRWPSRRILMRRYFDHILGQEMLIRLVTEETLDETVVITVYKTSQLSCYLRNVTP